MKIQALLVLAALVTSGGCVLKARNDETLAKALQCDADLKRLTGDRDQLAPKIDELKKKLAEVEARNEEISQTNQMLASKNTDFTRRSLEAQQEALQYKEQKERSEQRAIIVKQNVLELGKPFQTEVVNQTLSIKQDGDAVIVSIPSANIFTSIFDDLSSNGRKLLEKLAAQIRKQKPVLVKVESYGEAPPPSKKGKTHPASAWEATASSSAKVVKLMESQGIEPNKLTACGMGEQDTKIRRVDLRISF